MSIRTWIYGFGMQYFRRRRHARFVSLLRVGDEDRVLDVGGYPWTWAQADGRWTITCLNIDTPDAALGRQGRFECIRGDGRALSFGDAAYDVVHSNSVIEHVGSWEDQVRFASEVRRVARRLWVQTPNRWFPVELHLVAPFVHFLPRRLRYVLARWATPWGWENRPSAIQAREFVDGIRLLTHAEMRRLFPDCTILRERFLGLTKSLIAVRTAAPPATRSVRE